MSDLLDTCVISELVAPEPDPGVVAWVDSRPEELLVLSVVTLGEIRKGISRLPSSRKRTRLEAWFRDSLLPRFSGRILDLDAATMIAWGEMVAKLERRGRRLPVLDSLVAAIAAIGGHRLVTRNVRDFRGTGVEIVDPWS